MTTKRKRNHHRFNKYRIIEEQDGDRLSSLPDSIIEHIISFLPTLDAVRTTILSPRFRNLWFSVHSIHLETHPFRPRDYDDSSGSDSSQDDSAAKQWTRFSRFVNRVLLFHRRPTLEKFTFKFYDDIGGYQYEQRRRRIEDIDAWMWTVVDKKPKSVHVEYAYDEYYTRSVLLRRIWTCDSVIELTLEGHEIFLGYHDAIINMASLRILTLTRVDVDVDDENEILRRIIEGCPVLEELNLERADMRTLSFIAPGIKKLRLRDVRGYVRGGVITVDCPNLSNLFFHGCTRDTKFVNLSSLSHAELVVRFDNFNSFTKLMKILGHAQTLVFSESFLGMFAFARLKNLPCVRNSSKRIVLNTSGTYIEGLFDLLRSSPLLGELTINIDDKLMYDGLPKDVDEELHNLTSHDLDELNSEYIDLKCLRKCLKKITIYGYDKCTCDLVHDIAEVLLRNAAVLDEFTIKGKPKIGKEVHELTTDELLSFSRDLLSLPRASKSAKVFL